MKVSLNGRIPELTWGNNQDESVKFRLMIDTPVYCSRHDTQYYAATSVSETSLGGKFKPTLRSPWKAEMDALATSSANSANSLRHSRKTVKSSANWDICFGKSSGCKSPEITGVLTFGFDRRRLVFKGMLFE